MGEHSKTEKIPALIFAGKEAGLKIAALTVLDRLIVAIHRAGVGPITIVTGEGLPELKRAKALGVSVEVTKAVPKFEGRALVADGNFMVQASDVRRCMEGSGRLAESSGELLPMAVVNGSELGSARVVEDVFLTSGTSPSEGEDDALKRVEAKGIALVIGTVHEAKEAERALWATMWSSADGLVDRVFNRPVGRTLSKVLIYTPVSPNMVSVASISIGVAAAVLLAEGSYRWALMGAILFQISAIVDCVDGDIARIVFKESPLGKWIDLVGDQIVHISVFAGIAFGVLRNGGGKETVYLGASAILGALISFVVVLRGMRKASAGNSPFQKLIDAATNRDFSVLVLALAFAQKLPLFLWLAGIGSHLFWIAALGLQLAQKQHPAGQQLK
ncbi:MAG: CDP-alcohol phosphatidyltransferase family protein [Limisphaerales bacterium]